MNNPADYALGSSDTEHERLIRQAARLAPCTERLFGEAGIRCRRGSFYADVAYGVAAEYGRPVMLHPSRGANMPDYLTETESHTRESKHPDSVRSEDDYPESFREYRTPECKANFSFFDVSPTITLETGASRRILFAPAEKRTQILCPLKWLILNG